MTRTDDVSLWMTLTDSHHDCRSYAS